MPNYLDLLGGSSTNWASALGAKRPAQLGPAMSGAPKVTSNPLAAGGLSDFKSLGQPKGIDTIKPLDSIAETKPQDPTKGLSAPKQMTPLLAGASQMYGAISAGQELQGVEKSSAVADGAVGAISTGLSALGPWGAVAGAALKLVNGVGGSLMNGNKTAQMAKNFTLNSQVQQSSSYGGITGGAQDAQRQGNAYRKAGLFGKIFSGPGKLQDQMNTSNMQQTMTGNLLTKNKQAIEGGLASQDMFGARANNNLYNGGMWNNGSVQYGQSGMKIRLDNGGTQAVLNYQKMLNSEFDAHIAEDGIWGKETEQAFKTLQPEKYQSVVTQKGTSTPSKKSSTREYNDFNPVTTGGRIPDAAREDQFNPVLTGGRIPGLPLVQQMPTLNPIAGGRIPDDNLPKEQQDKFNPITTGGEIPALSKKTESKPANAQSKFDEFRNYALDNLKRLYPGKNVDIDFQRGGIYNSDGGRDITNQDSLKKAGASKTSVSLHNFDAARDYTIYVNGRAVQDSTLYKKVLWDAADRAKIYHLEDWDPGHIGLAKEGKGTAFDELKARFPEVLSNKNAARTIDYLNSHSNRGDYRNVLNAINGLTPAPMHLANDFNRYADRSLTEPINTVFRRTGGVVTRQHGGHVGVPHLAKPGIPSIQGHAQGAVPKLSVGNHAAAMGVEEYQAPEQKVENKGDKQVDFNQQVANTVGAKDPRGLQQPRPAGGFSADIMSMISQALAPISSNVVDASQLPSFKEGGAINVIVDGKLHAHKHDIEVDGNITAKGIPVVTMSEGGEVEQHAEVERDELILHYDLTKKLEELMEEGTEEAAIEAGRILSKEIIKNTRDSKSKILQTA